MNKDNKTGDLASPGNVIHKNVMSDVAAILKEDVAITLSKAEALILSEFTQRFSQTNILSVEHPSERQALWNLCCVFEKALTEPFDGNFPEIMERARAELTYEEEKNV